MKKRTRKEVFLRIMLVLTWVGFLAYLVEAGGILVSYVISCINPEGAKNIYNGLNLYDLRQNYFHQYTLSISFLAVLPILKAYISYLVIKTLSKFNMKNPFNSEVSSRLEEISYVSFETWVVTILSNLHIIWLLKITGKTYGNMLSGEFIFLVGLLFIIAQALKRGVEIQPENGLPI